MKNFKKLMLVLVMATPLMSMKAVKAAKEVLDDNMGTSLMIMSEKPVRTVSSQRTQQHYLDDFELMYQVKLNEMKKIKAQQEVVKNLCGIGCCCLPCVYCNGYFGAQNSYIRRRPDMFMEMFPDENDTRNLALQLITMNTDLYIKDKKDYPFFGSHTIMSALR